VAQRLTSLGFEASALLGGFDEWRRHFPVEPVMSLAWHHGRIVQSHGWVRARHL